MTGARTMIGLARSLVPAPATVVMAIVAAIAAGGLHAAAGFALQLGLPGAARFESIATTLLAMPVWVLIGGAMSQLSVRIVAAANDTWSWLAERRHARQSEAAVVEIVADEMMHPDWPGPRDAGSFQDEVNRRLRVAQQDVPA